MRQVASTLCAARVQKAKRPRPEAEPCWRKTEPAYIFLLLSFLWCDGASFSSAPRSRRAAGRRRRCRAFDGPGMQTAGAPSLTHAQPTQALAGVSRREQRGAGQQPRENRTLRMVIPNWRDGASTPLQPRNSKGWNRPGRLGTPDFMAFCDGGRGLAVGGVGRADRPQPHGSGKRRWSRTGRDRPIRPPGTRLPAARWPRRKTRSSPRRTAHRSPANSTASRLSTASLPAGFTSRHLHDSTRSKRSAVRRRWYSGSADWTPSQSKRLSASTTRFSLRPPAHVRHLAHRVLQVGGDDLQVLFVEDDEFKLVHVRRSRSKGN